MESMEKETIKTRREFEKVENFLKRGGEIVVYAVPAEYCHYCFENPVIPKGRPMSLGSCCGCYRVFGGGV